MTQKQVEVKPDQTGQKTAERQEPQRSFQGIDAVP